MKDFIVIPGKEISGIINSSYLTITDIIKDTYIAHYNGETINPNTYSLKFTEKPNARINALPAYVGAKTNMAGMKWISSFPDNIKNGIPRASAVVILNDYESGYPIACLEGSAISAARTAASAVIGAEVFNNKKQVDNIAFIGSGVISRYIFDFLLGNGWGIEKINLSGLWHNLI